MSVYNKTSPYYNTSIKNGYLDVLNFRTFPTSSDEITFTITKEYEYRPDLLAYELYKDSNLWWVFAVRNPSIIKDPIYDMQAGVIIRLPKATNLKGIIGL
jgi:hypothetical protein